MRPFTPPSIAPEPPLPIRDLPVLPAEMVKAEWMRDVTKAAYSGGIIVADPEDWAKHLSKIYDLILETAYGSRH